MHDCTPAHGDILELSGILDAFDEGLLIVGPDNRVACISSHLRHLLGITHDVPVGTDANHFVRWTLIPRICGGSGRTEITAFLFGRASAADFPCAMRLPGGGEGWFRCSCRAVHEGRFRGSRLVRFSPDTSGPGTVPVPETRASRVEGPGSGMDSAKRRRIEAILRESKDRYRFLVENLNEGIALIDREGIVVFANQKMADIIGYSIAGVIGAPVYAFVDENDAGEVREHLQSLGRNMREVFEFELVRKGGGRIHTLIATTPIIDTGGTCRGFLAGVQDITPLKRMEAKLRESEEKYRSLVELSAEATLIHRDGRIIFINPAGLKLFGASRPEEVIGMAILDIVHPDTRDLIEAFAVRDLQGVETPLVELLVVRLDGTTVPIEGRGARTIFEGQPAVQVVMRDIGHRKQAEEQLQARNRHLLLLNRIIGTSASTHLPGELLETALSQALDLLGYDGGAVYRLDSGRKEAALQCRRNMSDACLELAETVFGRSFADSIATGLPCYLEQDRGPNAPGSRLLREFGFAALACIPLVVESDVVGALLIGTRERGFFSHDERALLEAVGREIGAGIVRGMLYRRLEAANREANLYLDIMTHDIKNAENVSNLYTDLLLEMLEGEAALYARKIRSSIHRSAEILGNVTTIRRIHHDSPDVGPVDLAAVIREEVAAFPDVAIEVAEPLLTRVWADDLLCEVFTNLIRNAVKFGGGDVRMAIRVEDYDGESVLVSVEDTGPGIPDPMKESIFSRFERGWVGGYGDGLGLFIVRTLVERYGGTIRVEDRVEGRPDLGTAFRFTLREVLPAGDDDYPDGEECE